MKTHYKHLFLCALFYGWVGVLLGQQISYDLNTNQSGTTKNYVARDFVSLNTGFEYSPTTNTELDISIDPALLFLPTEGIYGNSDGSTNPQGGIVGTLPGEFTVAPTGAATYSIPIACPSGVNGMQPQLSFSYNSQAGNSILGLGWNLAGISVISRTNSTLYHDNIVKPASMSVSDEVMLDGQRLLKLDGGSLSEGNRFRTEIESYSEIMFTGGGFEVKTKEGFNLEYGRTADSKDYRAITWFISKATDANGNYISYTYETDQENVYDMRPKKIEYGGNSITGSPHKYSITFKYNERPDMGSRYFYNVKMITSRVLVGVEIRSGSTMLEEYELNYYYDNIQTKLTSIKLKAGGIHYNPTQIGWGTTHTAQEVQNLNPGLCTNTNKYFCYTDFDGDGRTDILMYDYGTSKLSLYLAKNTTNIFELSTSVQLSQNIEFEDILVGDFEGNGYCDFILITKEGRDNYLHQIYKFDGTSMTFHSSFVSIKKALIGDFDGDGRCEYINVETSELCQLRGNFVETIAQGGITWSDAVHTSFFPNNRYLLDFNGDGKTDVIVLHPNGYEIYTLSNSATNRAFYLLSSGSYPNKDTGIYFGDFNGDGKTDMLTQKVTTLGAADDNETALHLSTATGFTGKVIPSMQKYLIKLHIGDFNGDGKSDYAVIYNSKLIVGYSLGETFAETTYNNYPAENNKVTVGDFNGNGRDELLYNYYWDACIGGSLSKMTLYTIGKNDESRYVTQITDGMGRKVKINYDFTTNPNIYSCTRDVYPVPLSFLPASLKVVGSYQEVGDPAIFETRLKYGNSRIHRRGKGFLGFETIEATDVSRGIVNKTTFNYDLGYYYPYISLQESYTTSNEKISNIRYTNTIISLGGKRIFPYTSRETRNDNLNDLTTTISITDMDSESGNPGTITINKRGKYIETQVFTYIQKGAWCKNKVESVITTATRDNDTYTRKKQYEYDNKGNLSREIIDPDDRNRLEKQYNYDNYGNCTQLRTTANSKSRTSRMSYTSSGLFMATSTNPLNQTTTYSWDETRGLLLSKRDYANRITQYRYNDFGHLKETVYPDGTREGQENFWASPGNEFEARYYVYREASGTAPVITWYDALEREVYQEGYGLNSRKIFTLQQYNSKGQIFQISEPVFEGENPVWAAIYSYDDFGRNTTIATPMGVVRTSYNGLTTQVTTPDGVRTTTLDDTGKLVTSTVNGKSVSYTYYASGLTKSATPERGDPVEMEYDLQGNRVVLRDPAAGIIYSDYNGFGDIVEEKQKIHLDQNDIVTSYTYMDNGLLRQISQNGKNTVYSYDDYYRPERIARSGAHTLSYTYDEYDRPVRIVENIAGKSFSRSMEYTRLGQLKRDIYPSGYSIRNHYDEYGNLTSVTDSEERLIWQPLEENAKGQLIRVKRGSRETIYSFDNRGFPTSIYAWNTVDMEYEFNREGNLESRLDNLSGHEEKFVYDELNRLILWTVYKGNTERESEITYGSSGNILYTSELDNNDWGYKNEGSHQVTSILWAPALIPKTNLQISYTDFKKVDTLIEENKKYVISYGIDNERRHSVYSEGNTTLSTRYYIGDYEEEIDGSGNIRKIHYLPGGAIYLEEGSTKILLYGYYDYQGSLIAITNSTGSIQERYAYNPWGNCRDPDNWNNYDNRTSFLINRGYTMHEHLDKFGVINMNGRVYDPLTYSFFSPDPYIQAPDNWLNYNRYMYCYGNPLKYTDPSGEWFLIDDLIVGIAGFVTGYLAHGITKGNWGGKAFAAAAGGAVMSWLSYNTMGGAAAMSGWGFAGNSAINTGLGFLTPSVGFSIGDLSVSFSPIAMFTGGIAKGSGFGFGASVSASYQMGDWALAGGLGFSGGLNFFSYGLGYDDGSFGAAWHKTTYGGLITNNQQSTGTIGVRYKDWNIKHENDLGAMKGDGGDRYRTAAIELGWKDYMVGANVYTNDGKVKDPANPKRYLQNEEYGSRIFGKNSEGSYDKGKVYQSPFYIGKRFGKGFIKMGINDPMVQDLTQNFIHKVGNYPYYETPYGKYRSPYVQMGRINPFTLYGF